MPIFAVNMKHTPESCPMFNNEVRKRLKEVVGKRSIEEIRQKYGVKVLSNYTSRLDHLIYAIVEAPSQQAVESWAETGYAFWNNVEIKQVQLFEDSMKKVLG